jgi:hypothetical protein
VPESEYHKKIKLLLYTKLNEWYGCAIPEYYDEAHQLDAYAVTTDGITIYVEVIWSPSDGNFLRDLMIIQRADADLIFPVVNPKILENPKRVREFLKTQSSKRKALKKMSPMLNGDRILTDQAYVEYELKQLIDSYLEEKREEGKPPKPELMFRFLDKNKDPVDALYAEPLYIKEKIVEKQATTSYMKMVRTLSGTSRAMSVSGFVERKPDPDLVPIKISLSNEGTIGARDIHVFLKFPEDCEVISSRDVKGGGLLVPNVTKSYSGLYVSAKNIAQATIDSLGNDLIFSGWTPIYVRFPEKEQEYEILISIIQEGWPKIEFIKTIKIVPQSIEVEKIVWLDE